MATCSRCGLEYDQVTREEHNGIHVARPDTRNVWCPTCQQEYPYDSAHAAGGDLQKVGRR